MLFIYYWGKLNDFYIKKFKNKQKLRNDFRFLLLNCSVQCGDQTFKIEFRSADFVHAIV